MAERLVARAGFLAALLGAIVGCSDSGSGDATRPSVEDFVAAAAVAECGDLGNCCAQEGNPFDDARCRSSVANEFDALAASNAIAFDADAAGRCLVAFEASPNTCQPTREEFAACLGVFRGNLPIGAACERSQECDGYAGLVAWCEGGTCAATGPPSVGKLGDACGGTCRGTGIESACSYFSTTPMICLVGDGLHCSPTSHTCEPVIALGEPCSAPHFLSCADGAFCDGERCVPLRGEGESCLVEEPCEGDCAFPDALACRAPFACQTGTDEPVCVQLLPDGSACTSLEECASRWCERECSSDGCAESGVCRPGQRTSPEICRGDFESDAATVAAQPERSPLGLRRPILASAD